MNSDSSKCPENSNSTDCLLRTLIQLVGDQQRADHAEYNWDPVTFVFTAIIGVIAIIFAAFALIPVVQSLLVAGRANRRTSERAIGKWSKKRKRRWNKSEWTFDFILPAPVIRYQSVISAYWEEGSREARIQRSTFCPPPKTAATWPMFFSKVGLDESGLLDSPYLAGTLDAGFLPDDLVAAPAYAQVKFIFLAIALNPDAHTILLEGNAGYPIIIGHNFQFEFRQHPLLGLVGVFLPFTGNICAATLSCESLLQSSWQARGNVHTHHNGLICPFESPSHDGSSVAFAGSREGKSLHTLRSSVDQAFQRAHNNPRFFPPEDWMLEKYHIPVASNFLFKAPDHVPAMFPISKLGADLPLIPLALNGKYWAEVDIYNIINYPDMVKSGNTKPPKPNWTRFIWRNREEEEEELLEQHAHKDFGVQSNRSQQTAEATNEVSIQGFETVLCMCLSLLLYPSDTRRVYAKSPLKSLRLRQLALTQLREVDRWLATRCENREDHEVIDTRASCICTTTMLLLEANEAARNGLLGSPVEPRDQDRPFHASPEPVESTTNSEGEREKLTITTHESYGDTMNFIRQLLDFFNLGNSRSRLSYGKLVVALKKEPEPLHYELMEWFRQEAVHYTDSDLLGYAQDEMAERRENSIDEEQVLEEASRFYENLQSVDTQLKAIIGPEYHTPENYVNTHRALDRLGEIVVYHSEQEENWSLWERHSKGKEDEDGRELDDVIIYRCLLVALLFRTALDSSEILKSNLWDQVVPIL